MSQETSVCWECGIAGQATTGPDGEFRTPDGWLTIMRVFDSSDELTPMGHYCSVVCASQRLAAWSKGAALVGVEPS